MRLEEYNNQIVELKNKLELNTNTIKSVKAQINSIMSGAASLESESNKDLLNIKKTAYAIHSSAKTLNELYEVHTWDSRGDDIYVPGGYPELEGLLSPIVIELSKIETEIDNAYELVRKAKIAAVTPEKIDPLKALISKLESDNAELAKRISELKEDRLWKSENLPLPPDVIHKAATSIADITKNVIYSPNAKVALNKIDIDTMEFSVDESGNVILVGTAYAHETVDPDEPIREDHLEDIYPNMTYSEDEVAEQIYMALDGLPINEPDIGVSSITDNGEGITFLNREDDTYYYRGECTIYGEVLFVVKIGKREE